MLYLASMTLTPIHAEKEETLKQIPDALNEVSHKGLHAKAWSPAPSTIGKQSL